MMDCIAATGALEAVMVAEAVPGAIVTDAGTLRAALLLERETEAPAAGAAPASVTVQMLLEPPNKV
jgi:hypothetical protein